VKVYAALQEYGKKRVGVAERQRVAGVFRNLECGGIERCPVLIGHGGWADYESEL
jgi:creatinine amidohydrolase/Fe(II)-dependent formamide hydrolase-like protein